MFDRDRDFIADKYHRQDEPFDAFRRMAYHGYDFDESTGKSDEEILAGLKSLDFGGLSHSEIKAKAVAYVLDNTRIDVNDRDYYVGLYSLNRLANSVTLDVWRNEIFGGKLKREAEEMRKMSDSGADVIWPDFDHVVPDWKSVLTLGFPGLLDRVKKYKSMHATLGTLTEEKRGLFDGIITLYEAILRLLDRLNRLAESRKDEKSEKLPRIASCLKNIRDGAPSDFYEATQTMFVYFMVSECFDSYQVRSLGNGLDGSLYEFYMRDLASGTFSREQIREFLRYFMFQWAAIGNYWGQPFYLGGTNEYGETKYNELSYEILDVYDGMGIYNPKIQLKINENTPEKLLDKACDMIRRGHSSIVFCCEPGFMRAITAYGATEAEAREADIRGCYETGVRANEVSSTTGYVNAAKAVEYVFSDGYDYVLAGDLGLKTGDLAGLKTFDDFYYAVIRQWRALIEKAISVSRSYERYFSYVNPSLTYTATIEGALEKGRDAYQNGVKFNNSSVLNCGFATLVDSVVAVKKLVYDDKIVTLEVLKAALDANWEGYEDLRRLAGSAPKYGNGDYEADGIADALAAYFANSVNGRENARGGVYKAIMHTAMMFKWEGEKTAATPDGRKRGEEIGKNGSPSIGADREGVTALILSALGTRPYTYCESYGLDAWIHPSACAGEDGLTAMKGLLKTYMRGGGMSIQFNVLDTGTLRDAQKKPEKYRNLQVRVCGWNVLWNNLPKDEQDAYIRRAEING